MNGVPRLSVLALALLLWTASTAAQDSATATLDRPVANKKCDTWQRRVAKEEKSLADASDSIARDTRGRESCATKGACERYDQAIKSMEARRLRHETRLAELKSDAKKACNS